jgi:PEP-CTERM motif
VTILGGITLKIFGSRRSIFVALATLGATLPAFGNITYTCNANINGDSTVNACGTLQTTIAGLYSSTFSNANASIFIQFATNGSGSGLGGSNQFIGSVPYATYKTQLTSHEGPGDANDVTAVGSLPATDPIPGAGGNIILTTALANALGIGFTNGITNAGAFCSTPGVGNCYDGLITLNDPTDLKNQINQGYTYRGLGGSTTGTVNNYDFFSVAEHETDEVLGTISSLGTSAGAPVDNFGDGNAAAVDLFRYSAANTRSFLATATGTLAYFSINSGTTNIAPYNNSPNNNDYGDWSTNCSHVQDMQGCINGSLDITTDTNQAEIKVLDAVGFNLVPEPATVGLIGASLAALAFARFRRRRS